MGHPHSVIAYRQLHGALTCTHTYVGMWFEVKPIHKNNGTALQLGDDYFGQLHSYLPNRKLDHGSYVLSNQNIGKVLSICNRPLLSLVYGDGQWL